MVLEPRPDARRLSAQSLVQDFRQGQLEGGGEGLHGQVRGPGEAPREAEAGDREVEVGEAEGGELVQQAGPDEDEAEEEDEGAGEEGGRVSHSGREERDVENEADLEELGKAFENHRRVELETSNRLFSCSHL